MRLDNHYHELPPREIPNEYFLFARYVETTGEYANHVGKYFRAGQFDTLPTKDLIASYREAIESRAPEGVMVEYELIVTIARAELINMDKLI